MPTLSQSLANKEVILIDGATGTELERANVPMVEQAWSAAAALTHPDVVRGVHESYINVGAQMIIANTYSCSRHLLATAGLEHHFEQLNRTGVRLALEARANVATKPIVVAGSISTTEMTIHQQPPIDVARRNYSDQAKLQAAAGVDMFVLEMMRDIAHTEIALEAALQTGLPVWVGLSCVMQDGVPYLFNKTVSLADGLRAICEKPFELLAIMHTETVDIDACLDVVDQYWDGPIGVYAQSGDFIPPKWQFIDTITPADYGEACLRWVARGVQVIGGCCGIGPEHIAYLRDRLPKYIGAP